MKKTDFKLLELSVIVRAGESEEHDYTNVHQAVFWYLGASSRTSLGTGRLCDHSFIC